MAIQIGQQLGTLEITALLGKGGMGEVYRARDTRLKREVAIKILPDEFARDVDRVNRFQREAEVLASLSHQNIAGIYDLQEVDGARFLVLELVEGETLADRIARGPIPIDEALLIAKSICEALEAAHEQGIVHRDLKPANIKITPDGKVKVLDFGLAKIGQTQSSSVLSNSPTLLSGSMPGMIIGTAAYMSPEQARGRDADQRSDVFAFGCVLYEMLTGRQAFRGEDVSDVLASVMKLDPDWSLLSQNAPASIHKLIRRCLTKDRKHRLQAIGEARIVMEDQLANPESEAEGAKPAEALSSKLAWILAAVGIAAALIVSFVHFRARPAVERTQRYTITLPENTASVHSFAISPDSHYVAIAAVVNGRRQLWLRPLDSFQAHAMPGTEDATYPFWSPDSRHIGFFAQGKLKKVAASGGPPQSLCDAQDGRGGSWTGDMIVFAPNGSAGGVIQRVSANGGGIPADVTTPKGVTRYPVLLPDGRRFLYLVTGVSAEHNGIEMRSLDGKEAQNILGAESSFVLTTGYLLFVRENNLMAQSFDAASGQTIGEVFQVAEGVSPTNNSYTPVTASETGVLVYERGGFAAGENNQMGWYDRNGKLLDAVGDVGRVWDPAISPDEKSVAYWRSSASGGDLWVRNLARGVEQRLTTDASFNVAPFWSPTGDRIVFRSTSGGSNGNLYQKAASGTGKDELLFGGPNNKVPAQWSRDGRFIVYSELDPKTKWDISVLPMNGRTDRKPIQFLRSEFNELFGQLSPDNYWMAYTSDESGQREVYVRPFPTGDGQWRISIAGGEQPRWRGDGNELFFVGADDKMMAVAVKAVPGAKPTFEAGAPVPLFETHLAQSYNGSLPEYDVTADGKRFLIDTTGDRPTTGQQLNVVVNWTTGLKK